MCAPIGSHPGARDGPRHVLRARGVHQGPHPDSAPFQRRRRWSRVPGPGVRPAGQRCWPASNDGWFLSRIGALSVRIITAEVTVTCADPTRYTASYRGGQGRRVVTLEFEPGMPRWRGRRSTTESR
jgi:hypothetical protein